MIESVADDSDWGHMLQNDQLKIRSIVWADPGQLAQISHSDSVWPTQKQTRLAQTYKQPRVGECPVITCCNQIIYSKPMSIHNHSMNWANHCFDRFAVNMILDFNGSEWDDYSLLNSL